MSNGGAPSFDRPFTVDHATVVVDLAVGARSADPGRDTTAFGNGRFGRGGP